MPVLLFASPEPLAGRTTLAIGLAQRFAEAGRAVALLRLAGDDHAGPDAALFATLPFNAQPYSEPLDAATVLEAAKEVEIVLLEVPSGDPSETVGAIGEARALVVASGASLDQVVAYCRALGDRLAGLILNRVPQRRRDSIGAAFEAVGLRPLAVLGEDRTLAAPTLGQVAEAIRARASFLDANRAHLLDRLVIASISADPEQGYLASHQPSAVIVRGDKPDLQLAALNAGVPCLIITGGWAPLSYVLDRAEADQIPILRTAMDTLATVQRIEAMFATVPFAGGDDKLRSLAEVLSRTDLSALAGAK